MDRYGIAIRRKGFSGNNSLPFISIVRFGIRINYYGDKYVYYTSRIYWRWDKTFKGIYWSWEANDVPNWVSKIISLSGVFRKKQPKLIEIHTN